MRVALAGVALISVVLIFFFPAGSGPFSARYGPATALRGKRAAFLLNVSIFLSSIFVLACGRFLSLCRLSMAALPDTNPATSSELPALSCVLLC